MHCLVFTMLLLLNKGPCKPDQPWSLLAGMKVHFHGDFPVIDGDLVLGCLKNSNFSLEKQAHGEHPLGLKGLKLRATRPKTLSTRGLSVEDWICDDSLVHDVRDKSCLLLFGRIFGLVEGEVSSNSMKRKDMDS